MTMTIFREITDSEFDSFHTVSSIFGKEIHYEEYLIFDNGKPKAWVKYDNDTAEDKKATKPA